MLMREDSQFMQEMLTPMEHGRILQNDEDGGLHGVFLSHDRNICRSLRARMNEPPIVTDNCSLTNSNSRRRRNFLDLEYGLDHRSVLDLSLSIGRPVKKNQPTK